MQIVHKLDESTATDVLNKTTYQQILRKSSASVLEITNGTRKMSTTFKRSETNYGNTK